MRRPLMLPWFQWLGHSAFCRKEPCHARLETARRPACPLARTGGRRALLPARASPTPGRASSRSSAPEGDFARGYDAAAQGQSSYFVWLNRGKQSLVADIKDAADAALLHRILRGPTCSSRTSRPAPPRARVSAPRNCARRHPRLITVDISGYGETGDYATMKAYDLLVQAEFGPGDDHRPSRRPGPRRRLGLRHRLRHGGPCRRAGGADRARHHRARQGPRRSACSTAWRTG